MTTAAADYDLAVHALRTQKLPAYVSYTESAWARGLAGERDAPARITVDVATGKIVAESPKGEQHGDATPVTHDLFDPSCYRATAERATSWNGIDAIAISVAPTGSCRTDDFAMTTVYASAATDGLLGADGSQSDQGMQVDISVHYGVFAGYVMPTVVAAHAHGHGWLFWARERAEAHYSDYAFTKTRRQSP